MDLLTSGSILGSGLFNIWSYKNASSATKIAKADMKWKTENARKAANKNEANQLEAMQNNYLMGIRDANTVYVEQSKAISEQKHANSVGLGIGSITQNYDANKSSYYGDAEKRLKYEYEESIFSNTAVALEDKRRNSEMNQENIGKVIDETVATHMGLSVQESQFNLQQDRAKQQAKNESMLRFGNDVMKIASGSMTGGATGTAIPTGSASGVSTELSFTDAFNQNNTMQWGSQLDFNKYQGSNNWQPNYRQGW